MLTVPCWLLDVQKPSFPRRPVLVFSFSIPHIPSVRFLLFSALIFFPFFLSARGWTELDGVSYDQEKYSDGDSFRASRNRSRYIFRLYYVDAPETDDRYPDRLQEQAEYFGLTPEQILKGGKQAAEWLHNTLSKSTFTVYTRYADARGASDRKRYYAMVKIGDRWLSELLVENGFARVFGSDSDLPDGTSARIYWSRLRKLEREAKEARRGLWGLKWGNVPRRVKLTALTPVFHHDPPHRMVGNLPAGWEVTVGKETRSGFRKVSFISASGNQFEGEIQEVSLP